MYRENNKGPRTVPLGTPDKTGAQSDFTPITTTRFVWSKKRIYPFQCLATNSIAKQFAFKEFMGGGGGGVGGVSNAFTKSNMNVSTCPLLSKILAQSFITVVNLVSQLCPFLNACCLSDWSLYSSRWAMIFEHTTCMCSMGQVCYVPSLYGPSLLSFGTASANFSNQASDVCKAYYYVRNCSILFAGRTCIRI